MAQQQTEQDKEYNEWLQFHEPQLKQANIPASLHRRLFTKLKFEDFDLGQKVRIILDKANEKIGV